MTVNRVTLITLGVRDLSRSAAFYQTIGWKPEFEIEDIYFFAMAGQKFALYKLDLLARDLGRDPGALGAGAMSLAQNFPSVEAVDAAYQDALDAGAVALGRPAKADWGGYSGTFADPDGHVWEYAMNPFWALNDDGTLAS